MDSLRAVKPNLHEEEHAKYACVQIGVWFTQILNVASKKPTLQNCNSAFSLYFSCSVTLAV